MTRYNRINLDGMSNTSCAPAKAQIMPGTVANLVAGKFEAAADGTKRMYAVEKSQISVSVSDAIAAGDEVNGDKATCGRTFALLLDAAQTITIDDELKVVAGKLQKVASSGEGQFWANEALTTKAGENFLISVTVK